MAAASLGQVDGFSVAFEWDAGQLRWIAGGGAAGASDSGTITNR